MVEFQGKFDESKTKSLNNRAFKKMWWFFLLFSALLIVIGVVLLLIPQDDGDFFLGIAMIVLGVLFTPLVFLIAKLSQKSMNKSMPILSYDSTETYQFFPERLIITLKKKKLNEEEYEYEGTTNARYSYLFKVEETRDNYFLYISKVQSHVVSKSDLTQGTLEELNSILAANLGAKFKRVK